VYGSLGSTTPQEQPYSFSSLEHTQLTFVTAARRKKIKKRDELAEFQAEDGKEVRVASGSRVFSVARRVATLVMIKICSEHFV